MFKIGDRVFLKAGRLNEIYTGTISKRSLPEPDIFYVMADNGVLRWALIDNIILLESRRGSNHPLTKIFK